LVRRWIDEWLERNIHSDVVEAAVQALETAHRLAFLDRLVPASATAHYLVPALIDRDLNVFRHLLSLRHLADYHLRGLGGGLPAENWTRLVQLAADYGYSPQEIADRTLWTGHHSYAGFGTEHWQEWAEAFTQFSDSDNPSVAETAVCGAEMANRWIKKSEQERKEALLQGI
jgi:hypothetical protein